ncbi:MAG: 2-dehydro-3-deoxygluconokinase [Natronomonas sp.]|jgi:2-dehydro-3-deoxygluconokinase
MSELVTFGETMLRYTPPPGERLETADDLSVDVGGAESNVAVAASRLGGDTAWLSKLVDTPLGRRIERTLGAQGVTTDIVWSDEGRQGVYYFEPGGEPRGSDVYYDRTDAAITTATPAELATRRIDAANCFYTSGITPALSETLADTTATLLGNAQAAGTTTVFDVNYRSKLWSPEVARETLSGLLPSVDVLFVAARDAETVFGRTAAPQAVGQEFKETYGHDIVVVTHGEHGAVAVTEAGAVEQPAFDAETIDPVGTGDAFVGGFLAQYLAEGSIEGALEYGAATAALKRTLDGDMALVSPAEVAAVIGGDNGLTR